MCIPGQRLFKPSIFIFVVLNSVFLTVKAEGRLSGTITGTQFIGPGADTITGDLTIAPNAVVTLVPPLTLWVTALSDDRHSGLDMNRVEVTVQSHGTLKSRGTNSNRIVWRSTNTPNPTKSDWMGVRVDSSGNTEFFYNDFSTASTAILDGSRTGNDSIFACSFILNSLGILLRAQGQVLALDTVAFISGCYFQDDNNGVRVELCCFNRNVSFIDSCTFRGVDTTVQAFQGSGRISRNWIESDSAFAGINIEDWNDNDTLFVTANTIKGFYTFAHLRVNNSMAVITDNVLLTGEGTQRSNTGVLVTHKGIANLPLSCPT